MAIPTTALGTLVSDKTTDLAALQDLKTFCDAVNDFESYLDESYIGTTNPEIKITCKNEAGDADAVTIVIPTGARSAVRTAFLTLFKAQAFALLQSVAGIVPPEDYDDIARETREFKTISG